MSRRHAHSAPQKAAPGGDPNQKGVSGYKNEYIPNFISKKPFWLADAEDKEGATDYLEHQRLQRKPGETGDLLTDGDQWYDRSKTKLGPAATKFRKGACENCGSMGHAKRDCLQRIRAKGARFTGQDIAQDERSQSVTLGWDGKRDRWNGYDAREHDALLEEHARLEELRAEQKAIAAAAAGNDGQDPAEDKYADDSNMPGQTYDSSSRVTTRNLRIREDTAKYLLNLDLDSAKYDPKTRTMVDGGALSDQAAKLVAEEGFLRSSGDAAEFEKAQKLAWESRETTLSGATSAVGTIAKMHLQANPTEGEIIRRKLESQKADAAAQKRNALLSRYGGEEHLQPPPQAVAIAESERYMEYSLDGRPVTDGPAAVPRSKYAEDVYTNNHTSVWGSWWHNFKWGYACCHSFVKNSYCTGEEGIKGLQEAEAMRTGGDLEDRERKQIAWRKERQDAKAEEAQEKEEEQSNDESAGEEDSAEARKRKRDQLHAGVTEEELEQHRKRRLLADDPMAGYVDSVA